MNNTAEVIEFNPANIAAFDEFTAQLAELRQMNNKAVFDYEDPKGNKEARSHVYKLRQTKSAVEAARKKAKDSALQYGREVDSQAKDIKNEIEDMIAVHEAPLKEIEEREAKRVQAHQDRIEQFNNHQEFPHDTDAEKLASELKRVESVVIDDSFEEFKSSAAIAKDQAVTELKSRLEARQTYEAEQAELARLRKEKEEQERRDREAQIAREAEERARKEAEEQAAAAEKARKEQEEKERLQREKEEADRQAELERAKREKAEAEERAAKAEKEAKENAEREQREKAEHERQEAEKREANKKHKAKINNAAVKAMVATGITEDQAKAIVTEIAKGNVPHVSISY